MKVNASDKFEFENPDEDFDFENFDVGLPPEEGDFPAVDRTPVEQASRGFLDGVKQASTDTTLLTNVARKSLPQGYGSALDTYDDVKSKGLGLYNELSQEMKPAIMDLKRLGRRLKKSVEGVLPEKISGRLDKILAEDELRSMEQSAEQMQAEEINSATNEIFTLQQHREEEKDEQEATEKMVDRLVETKRHATQTDQLQNVGNLLSRQVAYQDSILINYQKKSLELDYKKYFILRDQFSLYKQYQPETMNILRSLMKNTALPDIVKMQNSEIALQMTKEKLIGAVQDKIAPQARDFLDSATKILGSRLKEKVEEFKEGVAVSSMAGDQMDMLDDMGEYGPSKMEIAGQMAGDSVTRKIGEWLGSKLKGPLSKNKEIQTMGNKLMFGSENYHKLLKEYMKDNEFDSSIMKFFQEVVLQAGEVRRESRIGHDQLGNATDATPFDNLTRKSIVEVIPGWLSRIYQAARELVTGQPQELMTYDHSNNSFDSVDNVADRISEMAVSGSAIEGMNRNLDTLVERMGLNEKLSEEGNEKLRDLLLDMAHKDKLINIEKVMDGNLGIQAGLSRDDSNALIEAFRSKVGVQEGIDGKTGETSYSIAQDNVEGSKLLYEMHRDLVSLRESVPNVYEVANQFANTGNREALRRTGITSKYNDEDHVNNEFVFKKFKGEKVTSELDDDSSSDLSDPRRAYMGSAQTNVPQLQDTEEVTQRLEGFLSRLTESVESLAQTPNLGEYSNDIDFDYDRLSQIAEQNSSKAETQGVLDAINEIKEFILSGSLTVQMGNGIADAEPSKYFGKIKGMGSKGLGMLKSGFGKGISSLKSIAGFGNKLLSKPIGMAKGLLKKLNPFKGGIDIEEAFLQGVKDPILTRVDLLRGQYFHPVTGKVITKWEEMSEGVKDINGKWIVTKEAIRNRLVDDKGLPIKKLNTAFSKVKEFVTNKVKGLFSFGMKLSPLGMLSSAAGFVKDKIGGLLSRPVDLYLFEKDPDNPILTKYGFKNGLYQDSKGNIITKPKEIKGVVYDESGDNILVQADEVSKLTTRSGKSPFKGILGKSGDMIKGGLSMAKGLVTGGIGMAKNVIKGGVKAVGGALSGLTGGFGGSNNTLNKIYRLLLQYAAFRGLEIDEQEETKEGPVGKIKSFFKRLVSPVLKEKAEEAVEKASSLKTTLAERVKAKKEKTLERTGNWRTKLQEMKEGGLKGAKDKVSGVKEKVKEKSSGFAGLLLGFMGKFAGLFGGILTGIKAIGTSIGTLIGLTKFMAASGGGGGGMDPTDFIPDGPDGPDSNKKGGSKGGKKGWLRRAAGGIWNGVKRAGRFVAGSGSLALRAIPAVVGTAKMVGAGIAGVGSALAAVASSPVVIAAAVIAGTVYAGYKAYKYFKDKLEPMQRLRFAQYGVNDLDTEQCKKIAILEEHLEDKVSFTDDGSSAKITGKIKFDILEKVFGVPVDSTERIESFLTWFRDRFKPVYLTHRLLCMKYDPAVSLAKMDEELDDKLKYSHALKSTHTSKPSPYDSSPSPFEDGASLTTGRAPIDKEIEAIKDEFGPGKIVKEKPTTPIGQARERVSEMNKGDKSAMERLSSAKERTTLESARAVNRDVIKRPEVPNDPYVNMTDGIANVYKPKKDTRDEIIKSVYSIADELGVSASILLEQIRNHSKFDPKVDGGLFGMKKDRFEELVDIYHGKYNTDDKAEHTDTFKSIYAAAEDLRNTQVQLQKANPGKRISAHQIQLAHQLGTVDPKKLEKTDDETKVEEVIGNDANYKAPDLTVRDYVQSTRSVNDETLTQSQQQVQRRERLERTVARNDRAKVNNVSNNNVEANVNFTKALTEIGNTLTSSNSYHSQTVNKLETLINLLDKFLGSKTESKVQSNAPSEPRVTEMPRTVLPTTRTV